MRRRKLRWVRDLDIFIKENDWKCFDHVRLQLTRDRVPAKSPLNPRRERPVEERQN
jgi:hypothetical protein